MFKLIFIIIIILAIWGGVKGAFNVTNKDGSISVDIDKSKVLESIESGASKAKIVIENIDQITTENKQ